MGARLGQAEKSGFQTGQLCEKLIWENTKEWWGDGWEFKGIRWWDYTAVDKKASDILTGLIMWFFIYGGQKKSRFIAVKLQILPSFRVSESSSVHSCQECLSHLILFTFPAERCRRVTSALRALSEGPAAAPRLYMATCACPQRCWPPAQPSFATPEACGAVFWIWFLNVRMEIGPAWLYLGCRDASDVSIVFKFNSSGPDGPIRVLHALRGDLVRPHTLLWPCWRTSFCEWAMCPRTPQPRWYPIIEGHTPWTRQTESRYLAFGPTTTANIISNGWRAFSSSTPMA